MSASSMASWLPHLDAALNVGAIVCLLAGLWRIRRGDESGHRRAMLSALGLSVAFLVVYLGHHAISGSRPFPRSAPAAIRWFYWTILATHVVLAALVPFLACYTAWLGSTDRRERHRRWAKVTYPIWLYVSVTGVVVYAMLYWLYAGLRPESAGL